MGNGLSLLISASAIVISSLTAWLTFFRRGELRMTRPTVVFFGPDGGRETGEAALPKVFLRTLLYSTSHRGQTVESLHINLQRGESRQNFSVWIYGEKHNLARGSGLFVGADGMACNHHFLLPKDGASFQFLAGEYTLRIFAKRVRDRDPHLLHEVHLRITDHEAENLTNPNAGIYFDWGPDQQTYHAHIDIRKQRPLSPFLFEANEE